MIERELQAGVIDVARVFGWRVAHFRSVPVKRGPRVVWETPVQADGAGFPDLVLVRERVIFAELKVGKNRMSDGQAAWLRDLRAAEADVYVWTDTSWSSGEIDEILRFRNDVEVWAELPDWPAYEVSNQGRVRRGGYVLRKRLNAGGYPVTALHQGGVRRDAKVHALVLETFVGARPEGHVGNHRNGRPDDNRRVNLEWATRQENAEHAARVGLLRPARGEANGRAKLTETDVHAMRASGLPAMELAERHGVSRSLVYQILSGERWPEEGAPA